MFSKNNSGLEFSESTFVQKNFLPDFGIDFWHFPRIWRPLRIAEKGKENAEIAIKIAQILQKHKVTLNGAHDFFLAKNVGFIVWVSTVLTEYFHMIQGQIY